VRHHSKVNAALWRKGRILTAIPSLVLSKVKSRAKQVCYSVVTLCRLRDVARKVKCEAVPPSRCVNGQRVGRPFEKARPPRGAASRVPVPEGVSPGLVPRRECSRPSTFRAPGASSGEVVAASPGGGPDALEIPTGLSPYPEPQTPIRPGLPPTHARSRLRRQSRVCGPDGSDRA
jgi:hypothetical protein